jgi:SAM-dependent methyltransferase
VTRRLLRSHGNARYCPVCDRTSGAFEPFGEPPREDAACPRCGSLERHRMIWFFLRRHADFVASRRRPDAQRLRLLHFAPEPCLEGLFRSVPRLDYVTADLDARGVMVHMDITRIPYPEGSFDSVLCSHVIEHVPDDRRALAELYRVLRPGGWAIVMVPLRDGPTVEDPTIADPAERLRRFGQADHVRVCGHDYVDRVVAAGFDVRTLTSLDLTDEQGCTRMGFRKDHVFYYAARPER